MTSPSIDADAQIGEDAGAPAFRLAQVYLVHANFGHRVSPLSLDHKTPLAPHRIRVLVGVDPLNDGAAMQVRVAIETDPEDQSAFYEFSAEVAGVVDRFDPSKVPQDQLAEVIATMIFPFIREVIANLTSRGRFGPIWINPFNIRALFQKAMAQKRMQDAEKEKSPTS